MNTDVVQRILHLLAHLQDVSYTDFSNIKKYIASTEYDASYGQLFEEVDNFYQTRHNKLPDYAWIARQFPSYFVQYIPTNFHSDDIYVLENILREESYKNRVLSSTYNNDLEKSLNLLTEYKNSNNNLSSAPTSATEVFENFNEERENLGHGITTGFTQIDADIDFLQYKNFTVLIAPVKSYKTLTACNIVYDAVMYQGKNVVYLTLEDTHKSIWANLLAKHSYTTGMPITTNEIKKYKLTKDRDLLFDKMKKNFDESKTGNLVVLSSEHVSSFTPDNIESQLRYYEKLFGSVDMVVVDHFSIMTEPIPGRPDLSGASLAKEYVRFMTKLSISFSKQGFVLLGLAQVTREYTERLLKGEKMQAIGSSSTSEIERSCSLMLCSFASDEMKKSGNVQLSIVINRNGPSDISYTIPVKPEFSIVGEPFVDTLDDEVIEMILHGDLDIPVKNKFNFGISFTQFVNSLSVV